MKVATVFGGPRPKGNTVTVLEWVEDELRAKGHEVDRINVVEHKVGGCIGCFACQRTATETACIQKDDVPTLLDRLIAADVILYASPLYCWSWTGQLKAFLDRHVCLVNNAYSEEWSSLVGDRPVAVLVTAAGPIKDNADLLIKQFDGMAAYLKAKSKHQFVVPGCTTPDAIPADVKEEAAKFARELIG